MFRVMKNSVVWLKAVWLASVVGLGLGVANANAAMPEKGASAEKQDAAALYLNNCAVCHGEKGDGNTPARSGMFPKPRNFTTPEAAIELTRQRMIKSVTEGRPGTAMMAHKKRLTGQQIELIVDYIRSHFMQVSVAETGAPAEVSLGEKIYTSNCSVCHGDNGNTAFWAKNGLNPPPRDFTSPEAQGNLTRARMVNSVTNGRPGTGMMPFNKRLSRDEINEVVSFIRYKFMGVAPDKDTGEAPLAIGKPVAPVSPPAQTGSIPGVDAPLSAARPAPVHQPAKTLPAGISTQAAATAGHGVDMSLPVPKGLKGDLVWARKFYMANCFTCHGVTGQGNGPRAFFNIPRPRNFTSEESRQILNRPRIFNSITNGRVGTVMPAWGKVLNEQQIAGLTEFVFQTFVQPTKAANANSKKKAP